MRRLLLVLLLLLATAEMGAASRPGARHPRRKIRVTDAALAREIEARGGRLLADYGSYLLLEVEPAIVPDLVRTRGVETRDHDDLIQLNSRTIDTASEDAQASRAPLEAFTGRRLHLIQFVGPVRPAWHAALERTGVEVVTYVPSNAYLVYGDDASLARLRRLAEAKAFIQWDGPFRDEDRIHPAAAPGPPGRTPAVPRPAYYAIQLVNDSSANDATLRVLDTLRVGDVRSRVHVLNYVNVIARLTSASLLSMAARPDVVSIQPYVVPTKRDERQGQIVAGNLTGGAPTGPGYLAFLAEKGFTQAQFTASGFAVDVTDSGIDDGTNSPNHFGLFVGGSLAAASRVVYNRLEGSPNGGSTLAGCDGHGTINSHIVSGFNDLAGFPHEDAGGFNYGLGIAPFVKVGSSVIFDPDTFTFPNFPNLQSRAYRDGARVSTNSWGANVNGAYTVDSQAYDALVRDAQPAGSDVPVAGNQQMVIAFAAGNQGPAAQSLNAPGSAKNVITVGASENVRALGGADQCGLGDIDADAAGDIAPFSSRGPTSDGRRKPEIVAPGTHVTGGVYQTTAPGPNGQAGACFSGSGVCGGVSGSFFPDGQQFYTASSGTSHSTPAVAGGVALIRQRFINQGLAPPSPAMTKAYLVSSARYLSGAGAGDSLWSNSQGMGLMDLGVAFDTADRILRDQVPADMFTASGQTRSITGTITDSARPFRVSLAWTDAPGSTIGNAYRNDLDLTVRVGGVTYRGNVFSGATSVAGGVADPRNNLESVFLPAGVTGNFTVTITATNINSDGVPNSGGALDQDFAVVVYNGMETPVPNIVPAGATLSSETCGVGNGAIDPGETVTVSFAFSNTGTGDTTSLLATLLPTGGVNAPSGPQSYGVVTAGGAPVARPFTFAASGACGGSLTATLQLQDGGSDLGTIGFAFTLGATAPGSSGTFTNTASITIPSSGAATPYPSSIVVSGLTGTVMKVTARLNGFGHSFPDDVDVLLAGPGGQRVLLMSDAGGGGAVSNLTLTFDDAAASALPDGFTLASGTYRPSNYEAAADTFPAPAPGAPYGGTLSAFDGTNPNGTWSVFVRDDFSGLAGSISGGWSVTITTATPVCCAAAAGFAVSPTAGLVTTEAGGTAAFTLALNSVPTANITIGLTSSDPTEGSVSPASLTFTPGNALTPQTVTVTGVDDGAVDGSIAYSIVTAPAVSADPAYNGLDPADVSVTNNDNDVLAVPVIAPAGGTLLTEDCGTGNGAIDPGETVLVDLALVNAGTGPTTSLVGTLLATGGVGSPSTPQMYGVLLPGGPPLARPYMFTASGTCGGTLTATLQLQDGATDLGTVSFSFGLGALAPGSAATVENATAITIPASGPATPYPSAINASGLSGTVTKVTAKLTSLTHTFPDDIDVLLVGPGGQRALLMSDAGGGGGISDVSLTLDDAAPSALPDGSSLVSGTYQPSNFEGTASDAFPAPAPGGPYAAALSTFNGTDPNGTWSLFVRDDFSGSAGSLAGGWSLTITTAAPVCCTAATAGFTVTPTSGLVTTEAGGTSTLTVVLTSTPTADVTIGLSSSDTTEGTVSPASLTFTSANALTPQTVTLTGADDVTVDGNVAYSIVTAPAASSDSGYNGVNPPDVSATNNDNDVAAIAVTPTSGLVTTEAGGTATFTVALTSTPTDDVTIGLSSSDTTEGTVSPASLTFTSANALTPQTVTLTGADDTTVDGNVAYSIVTAPAASSDSGYNGVNPPDVSATNNDNDVAAIAVTPTSGLVTTEAGGTATFTVALTSTPTDDVTIGLSSSDTTEGTVSPSSLTFTPANALTSQTVTVTGVNDTTVDGSVGYSIVTAVAASTDSAYNGVNPPDVSATNNDDDVAAITVTPTAGLVTTEAGGTATFAVVLTSTPTADVTIGLSSSDTTEGTVSPSSLTFTTANALTPQTVTVTGVDDPIVDGNIAYSIVTAPAASLDPVYNGRNGSDPSVTNSDDEPSDLIFKDGFESGDFSRWSSIQDVGGRLTVSTSAALDGSRGLSAFVNDTNALYVQDDSPTAETRYRARFLFDPNGFNLGGGGNRTLRFFAAFQSGSTRTVTIVLRRQGGQFSVQVQVRLDSGSQRNTSFFNVADAPHSLEIDWRRSSGPGANNGSLQLWIDGTSVATLTGLDNNDAAVGFVRMGPLNVGTGALGTLFFDRFESRRSSFIGP